MSTKFTAPQPTLDARPSLWSRSGIDCGADAMHATEKRIAKSANTFTDRFDMMIDEFRESWTDAGKAGVLGSVLLLTDERYLVRR